MMYFFCEPPDTMSAPNIMFSKMDQEKPSVQLAGLSMHGSTSSPASVSGFIQDSSYIH